MITENKRFYHPRMQKMAKETKIRKLINVINISVAKQLRIKNCGMHDYWVLIYSPQDKNGNYCNHDMDHAEWYLEETHACRYCGIQSLLSRLSKQNYKYTNHKSISVQYHFSLLIC